MTRYYWHQPDGGFLVGDDATGLTSYAFPRSIYARRAEMAPELIADQMLRLAPDRDQTCHRDRLDQLRDHGTQIQTPEQKD